MIALMMAASLLTTGPVYLECQLTGEMEGTTPAETPWLWSITLNEEEGRAEFNNGRVAERATAIFTANEVRFNSISINRTDLTMTRVIMLGGTDRKVATGRCRVAQPANRAF